MDKILSVLLIMILFMSCEEDKSENSQEQEIKSYDISSDYSIKIIDIDSFYGYKIEQKGKVVITQNYIPAVQGNQSFKSKEDALKVGEIMKSKMEKGIFPPSITIDELDSLNIKYEK